MIWIGLGSVLDLSGERGRYLQMVLLSFGILSDKSKGYTNQLK